MVSTRILTIPLSFERKKRDGRKESNNFGKVMPGLNKIYILRLSGGSPVDLWDRVPTRGPRLPFSVVPYSHSSRINPISRILYYAAKGGDAGDLNNL